MPAILSMLKGVRGWPSWLRDLGPRTVCDLVLGKYKIAGIGYHGSTFDVWFQSAIIQAV